MARTHLRRHSAMRLRGEFWGRAGRPQWVVTPDGYEGYIDVALGPMRGGRLPVYIVELHETVCYEPEEVRRVRSPSRETWEQFMPPEQPPSQ